LVRRFRGSGNDLLTGSSVTNWLYGGDGMDTLDARDGNFTDYVACGNQPDTVFADRQIFAVLDENGHKTYTTEPDSVESDCETVTWTT
jgi:Ca2+-binding RTX toxin-like protein